MNSIMLSNIIKEVIEAEQSNGLTLGLTVISTVCDQAPTNVTAINRLCQESNIQNLKKKPKSISTTY